VESRNGVVHGLFQGWGRYLPGIFLRRNAQGQPKGLGGQLPELFFLLFGHGFLLGGKR